MIYDDLINCVVVFLVMLVYMLEDFFRKQFAIEDFFLANHQTIALPWPVKKPGS